MKQLNQRSSSRHPLWHRVTSIVTLIFFLCQITGTAIASTLSAAQITTDLDNTYEFEKATNASPYQYIAASTLLDDEPTGLPTIESFYQRLKTQFIQALGPTIYVPIAVGDITVIIPTQDNPKAVGSPFVQSRYVRNQIRELLGRHLINADLDQYSSEAVQLVTLYGAAFNYALATNTLYGQPLPDDPLTINHQDGTVTYLENMVWPEKRVINGQTVVVPIVYLNTPTIEARKVDGHIVEFNGNATFGSIEVAGVNIKAGRDAFIQAADYLTLTNASIEGVDNLTLVAGGTLTLLSSLVHAHGNLVIGAHSVQAQTLVHRYDLGNEQGTRFGEITLISSGGDVSVNSLSDIVLRGVDVISGGSITFGADRNIYIGSLQNISGQHTYVGGWDQQKSSVEYLQSHLTAEESITLMARGEILIDSTEMISNNGHIEILAGLGITIQDDLAQSQSYRKGKFGKKKIEESVYQTVAIRSALDAGKGIILHSDYGDITLKAVAISSTEGTHVKATNGSVNLLMTTETDHYSYSSVKKGMFTTRTVNRGHDIETGVYNTIVGGFAVEALDGVNVEYGGLKGADCSAYLASKGISSSLARITMTEEMEIPCLRANILKIAEMPGMDWMAQMLTLADADPTGYQWDKVVLQYKEWNESHTTLSPALMAVIAIAVVIATQGAGAGLILGEAAAASSSAALVGALNAGFTTLVTQSTLAVANGAVDGDIGNAMRNLASEETIKSLATSMVTAGAIAGLDAAFFDVDAMAVNSLLEAGPATPEMIQAAMDGATQSLTVQVGQALTNATVTAGANVIINGGSLDDLGDQFVVSLGQTAVNRLGQELAQSIGDWHEGQNTVGILDTVDVVRYIAHAATGCLTGTLTNEINDSGSSNDSCLYGAGGAVVGEAVADIYANGVDYDDLNDEGKALNDLLEDSLGDDYQYLSAEELESLTRAQWAQLSHLQDINQRLAVMKANGVDLARLSAAIGAFVTGAEAYQVNLAADSGENAAENNALFIIPLIKVGLFIWSAVELYNTLEEVYALSAIIADENATPEAKQKALEDLAFLAGSEALMSAIPGGKILGAAVDKARKSGILSDELLNAASESVKRIEHSLTGSRITSPKGLEYSDRALIAGDKIDEIYDLPKGSRPEKGDPNWPYTPEMEAAHLARFDNGAVRITTQANIDAHSGTIGGPSTFVLPRDEFEMLVKELDGDMNAVIDRLDFSDSVANQLKLPGQFRAFAIEPENLNGLRMASGRESGADALKWTPGGFTKTGVAEAIIDFDASVPHSSLY